jgi:hypothetical protein
MLFPYPIENKVKHVNPKMMVFNDFSSKMSILSIFG